MKKLLIAIIWVSSLTVAYYSQGRPKTTKKIAKPDVVLEQPSSTNPLVNQSSLPEENETSWKYLSDSKAAFKILFPGDPLKKLVAETFNKKEFIATSYGLESKRTSYFLTYYNMPLVKQDATALSKLYDSFDKEVLSRANSGLRGVTTKIVGKKEFSVNGIVGRETTVQDIDGNRSTIRQIFANGRFYYFFASPDPYLNQADKEIANKAVEKFFESFEVIQK